MNKIKQYKYIFTALILLILMFIAWGNQSTAFLFFLGVISTIIATFFFIYMFVNISRKANIMQTIGSWMIVSFVAIMSFIVGTAGAIVGDDKQETTGKRSAENVALHSIDDKVKHGDIEFEIQKVYYTNKIGVTSYVNKEAEGKFLVAKVKIKNVGNKRANLLGNTRAVYDDQNRKHESESFDETYFHKDPSQQDIWNELNPGVEREGHIVFDVPKDANIQKIALAGKMTGKAAEWDLKDKI